MLDDLYSKQITLKKHCYTVRVEKVNCVQYFPKGKPGKRSFRKLYYESKTFSASMEIVKDFGSSQKLNVNY